VNYALHVFLPPTLSVREYYVVSRLSGVVTKKWLTLAIGTDHVTALEWISAEDTWYGKSKRREEQQSHDDESLDPLDGNNDSQELGHTESWKNLVHATLKPSQDDETYQQSRWTGRSQEPSP
jgi:hypothetical protein